jgi:transposase-like protein
MQETSTSPATILQFRQDIEAQFRRKIREALETALTEELAAALGSQPHERTEQRRGYRNGSTERTITTADGTRAVTVPRGRVGDRTGATQEFHSQLLPRYARRTSEIDEAILGCYLGGVNSRRMRTALKPLLGERHLSKSAVSRIVGRLKALFTTWQGRDLSTERYAVIFLDGFHLKVRSAKRVVSVPVLAALGVAENGKKCLLQLRLAASEAQVTWGAVVTDLQQRGLAAPLLLVVDGNGGLKNALKQWEGVRIQRCTTHKLENLKAHCPQHARAEMKRDYDGIIYAEWPGRAGSLRRVREEVEHALPRGGQVAAGSWPRAPDVLRIPQDDVEIDPHHEHDRESQSRISAADEDAGLVQHRRRRADRAVWARGLRADSTAEDRWLPAAAVVPREGVEESRVRT